MTSAGRRRPCLPGKVRERCPVVSPNKLQLPPVPRPGKMDHQLAHLGPLVRVFHEVGLVDDVDQGARSDDAPEDPVDAQTQLPLAVADVSVDEKVGLAQVGVGAVWISGVVSVEQRYRDASALVVLGVGRYLRGKAARVRALVGDARQCRGRAGFPWRNARSTRSRRRSRNQRTLRSRAAKAACTAGRRE